MCSWPVSCLWSIEKTIAMFAVPTSYEDERFQVAQMKNSSASASIPQLSLCLHQTPRSYKSGTGSAIFKTWSKGAENLSRQHCIHQLPGLARGSDSRRRTGGGERASQRVGIWVAVWTKPNHRQQKRIDQCYCQESVTKRVTAWEVRGNLSNSWASKSAT